MLRSSADSFFFIGKSHTVCQDRALAGTDREGNPFAIVCDGCSSSPDTDIGAWMLARAAFSYMATSGPTPIENSSITFQAQQMQGACRLSQRALDATLLVAYTSPTQLYVEAFGDGVVVARKRSGELEVREIEFPSGAPAYLNYRRDVNRLGEYLKLTNNAERYVKDQTGFALHQFGFGHSFFSFHRRDYDMVAVLSDGATSFQRRNGSTFEHVPTLEVLPYLVGFKNYAGDFVTRRVRRFLTKEMLELGWHHDDDLSVASIYVPEFPT